MNEIRAAGPTLHFARFDEWSGPRKFLGLHVHPHWQVELIVDGTFDLVMKDDTFPLKHGNIVILPPGIPHNFSYKRGHNAWYTIRFSYDSPSEFKPLVVADSTTTHMFTLLTDLLETAGDYLDKPTERTVEHILAALITYNYDRHEPEHESSGFLEKIRAFLNQNCRRAISVKDVARCVGYSESHTRSQYKRLAGKPLKHAIDHARFDEAMQYLLHTDYTISEIAAELGFPDVYSFSRFVRRLALLSPRQVRAKHMRKPSS